MFFPVYFSPYEENQKGYSSDKPLLGPKIPPRPKHFDAKMVYFADFDKSANTFSRMRVVQDLFSAFYIPYEENQKVCLSNQPLLGSMRDPKISPRHDFDAKMLIFY